MTVDPNTAPLSEARLDEIEALARKATTGPLEIACLYLLVAIGFIACYLALAARVGASWPLS